MPIDQLYKTKIKVAVDEFLYTCKNTIGLQLKTTLYVCRVVNLYNAYSID